jgi:hypothetical protein
MISISSPPYPKVPIPTRQTTLVLATGNDIVLLPMRLISFHTNQKKVRGYFTVLQVID